MCSTKSTQAGRITVYGSCVARDAAREMEKRGWSVERYVARQSLISAGRPADVGDVDLSLLPSPFARRSFLSDMVGNLEAQLTSVAARTDLLLWDLTDERLGVLETAPGAFLTRSAEALTAGLYKGLAARFLELGTAEHLHLWRPALLHFGSLLDRRRAGGRSGSPQPCSGALTSIDPPKLRGLVRAARRTGSKFSTGPCQSLAVGACVQVVSIHRSDGHCRPSRWCEELFRWRGGYR